MTATAAAAPGRPEPLFTATFFLLIGGHFLQACGYATMTLFPLYLEHLEASRTQIGLIMAAPAIGGLATRPLVGWALDTVGRKQTVTVGTLLLVGSMLGVAGVVAIGPYVYLLRLVFGMGLGALFTGYFTFAADVIPESRRTEGIAIFGISGLMPLVINGIVGFLHLPAPALRWFFPLVGGAILLSLVFLWRLREPAREDDGSAPFSVRAALQMLRGGALLPVWWATLLFGAPVAVFLSFATVVAEGRGLANPAVLWFTYAGGAATVRLLGARLPDRLGPRNLVAPSMAAYVGGLVAMAFAATPTTLMLAGLLAGLGHGYVFPVVMAQAVQRASLRLRGTAVAMFTALFDLAILLFTPLFGAVADASSDGAMFALAALIAVAGLAGWGLLEHLLHPREGQS